MPVRNKYSTKLYRLYCEICNFNLVTDGRDTDKLVEIKTSPIPGGIPKKDILTGNMTVPKSIKQPKKFRCPKCGRIIVPRLLVNEIKPVEVVREVIETQEEILNQIIKRLDDIYDPKEEDNAS